MWTIKNIIFYFDRFIKQWIWYKIYAHNANILCISQNTFVFRSLFTFFYPYFFSWPINLLSRNGLFWSFNFLERKIAAHCLSWNAKWFLILASFLFYCSHAFCWTLNISVNGSECRIMLCFSRPSVFHPATRLWNCFNGSWSLFNHLARTFFAFN